MWVVRVKGRGDNKRCPRDKDKEACVGEGIRNIEKVREKKKEEKEKKLGGRGPENMCRG